MLRLNPDKLRDFIQQLFERVGSESKEAERIAFYLVQSNLTGHDSHGVIRAPYYIDYVKNDQTRTNQSLSVIFQTDSMAIVDGNFGFGQVIVQCTVATVVDAKGAILVIGAMFDNTIINS